MLWRVRASTEIEAYFWATSKPDSVALEDVLNEAEDAEYDRWYVEELEPVAINTKVPRPWDRCIPYYVDDIPIDLYDKTVKEILEKLKQDMEEARLQAEAKAKQTALFKE